MNPQPQVRKSELELFLDLAFVMTETHLYDFWTEPYPLWH